MILGIDTSIGTAVAVVDDDGTVRSEIASADRLGHAERIGTMIEQALAAAGASPSDVTAVAAGMGPGPFTGLRVGIATARTFAMARGIPVVPVVSHDAAALTHRETPDASSRPFAVITDARRREVAVSVYAGATPAAPAASATGAPATDAPAPATGAPATDTPATGATGPGTLGVRPERLLAPALHAKGADVAIEDLDLIAPSGEPAEAVEVTSISAAALARVAAQRIADGVTDAAASEPLYLRSPDVILSAGPKRVTA